jgi:hypothetical protein
MSSKVKKLVVAAIGKRGSGKNTAANQIAALYLNSIHGVGHWVVNTTGQLCRRWDDNDLEVTEFSESSAGHGIRYVSFADPLKRFCRDVLGLSWKQCYGTNEDKDTRTRLSWDSLPVPHTQHGLMSAREVLQVFGTDLVRAWYPTAWVDAAFRTIQQCPHRLVLVTDCRFPNELEALKALKDDETDVFLIRLMRTPHGTDAHASESSIDTIPLDAFHLVIGDCGDVEAQRELLIPQAEVALRTAGLLTWETNNG